MLRRMSIENLYLQRRAAHNSKKSISHLCCCSPLLTLILLACRFRLGRRHLFWVIFCLLLRGWMDNLMENAHAHNSSALSPRRLGGLAKLFSSLVSDLPSLSPACRRKKMKEGRSIERKEKHLPTSSTLRAKAKREKVLYLSTYIIAYAFSLFHIYAA